jgi:membrane fusion protein (multidrug efflux system)
VVANARALAASVGAAQASAASANKQVDQRRAQLTETQQRAEEARKNAPRQVAVRRANVSTRQAAVASAKAQLQQALLNLSYCKISTPVAGIVARRTAELGQHVTPGQQIVLVTQTADMWVTANFRETQLRLMRTGQSARIHVDALGQDFDGYVEGMPAASGAVTILLPPENATGNFV